MRLSKDEIQVLEWASPEGMCAIIWPTGADDDLYLAGTNLERLGFLESLQRSPERWRITPAGRAALSMQTGD